MYLVQINGYICKVSIGVKYFTGSVLPNSKYLTNTVYRKIFVGHGFANIDV